MKAFISTIKLNKHPSYAVIHPPRKYNSVKNRVQILVTHDMTRVVISKG